jgi:hypothetical protein
MLFKVPMGMEIEDGGWRLGDCRGNLELQTSNSELRIPEDGG